MIKAREATEMEREINQAAKSVASIDAQLSNDDEANSLLCLLRHFDIAVYLYSVSFIAHTRTHTREIMRLATNNRGNISKSLKAKERNEERKCLLSLGGGGGDRFYATALE